MRKLVGLAMVVLVAAACSSPEGEDVTVTPGSVPAGSAAAETAVDATTNDGSGGGCADVVDVEVTGDGPYTFSVTVASPDTGWDKYADAWKIESDTGETIGVRELTHPHVDEQPFTRSLSGVDVAAGDTVSVSARDSVEGYCGETVTVTVGG